MRFTSATIRVLGTIALFLGSLMLFASGTSAATQTGNSSIEVHNRNCPTDYAGNAHFEDCHANVPDPGLPFTFTHEDSGETWDGTTNENGNVGFGNLPSGTYTVTGGAPGDFSDMYVYCSTEAGGEEIATESVAGGVQFELPAETNVVCDWYNIPLSQNGQTPVPTEPAEANSSIEVHNRVCPEGYEGENWFEDCHANVADPGLPFTFTNGETREGTTNENGNIGFANLPASTYEITGGAPGEFTDFFVYCATEADGEQVPVNYVTGGITVDLAESTNLVCDWYIIPQGQNGETPAPTEPTSGDSSIEVHHRICPTEYEGENWFEDCHGDTPDPGLSFTFANGVTNEGTTNENGNIGFANLPAGAYTITGGVPGEFAEHTVYCSDESTDEEIAVEYVTGGVQLELPSNTNVVCDWYEIPYDLQGDPTATAPSTDQFDLPIYALLCDSEPAAGAVSDFVMMGETPANCEQYGGAFVSVLTADGTTVGNCETAANDPCTVSVEVGTTVTTALDVSTLPGDYAVAGNRVQDVEIPTASEAWAVYVAVPAVQTPVPTTEPDPAEGRNLAIHEGSCTDDSLGSQVVQLGDLITPEDDQASLVTNEEVLVAERSFTIIDQAIDNLTSSNHAVVAFGDDGSEEPVACTVIGGAASESGELIVGFQEANDSGFAGVVYIAPIDDESRTVVQAFLVEGLAEDAETDGTPTPGV